MARESMVTRTITFTVANVMMIDTASEQVSKKDVIIPKKLTEKDKVLSAAKELFETETEKIVAVNSFEHTEQRYGMTEQSFIELASPIKPYKAGTEENNQ